MYSRHRVQLIKLVLTFVVPQTIASISESTVGVPCHAGISSIESFHQSIGADWLYGDMLLYYLERHVRRL